MPLSFCLQTRIIAQITGGRVQSKTLKKQEASLLFLLLTKRFLTYQDAEQATQTTIDTLRHSIIPGLNDGLGLFHLEIVAVQDAGFTLFDILEAH